MGIRTQSLARLHHLLGRSNAITNFAQKIRNQASAVVASHFTDLYPAAWNADPVVNGEYLLIDTVAPMSANFIDLGAHVGAWSARFIEQMKAARRRGERAKDHRGEKRSQRTPLLVEEGRARGVARGYGLRSTAIEWPMRPGRIASTANSDARAQRSISRAEVKWFSTLRRRSTVTAIV